MTAVAIVKGTDPSQMVTRALRLIGADTLVTPDDRVLVKPNYVSAKPPSTGITTDTRVVESVVAFLQRHGVRDLVVGEGGAGDTDRAFDVVGIREVTARRRVPLVNLNRDARVPLRVPQPLALREVGVARTALERTGIVNVPKLKVHHMATVTLCMKNLMGLILPKSIMHGRLHEKIVDLATLFADKVQFNVVDGLVGADRDETHGRPVPMNLVIAGQDMVAVDTVATRVMGLEPERVRYLALAEERGLGVATLDRIDVLGTPIEDVAKRFSVWPRDANATDLIRDWTPLFDAYHVDIVVQGHTHHYHRTRPMRNGTVVASYQEGTMYVTAVGGARLHPYVAQPYSAYGNAAYHYVVVRVSRDGTLHLAAQDIDGTIFDEVWLSNAGTS